MTLTVRDYRDQLGLLDAPFALQFNCGATPGQRQFGCGWRPRYGIIIVILQESRSVMSSQRYRSGLSLGILLAMSFMLWAGSKQTVRAQAPGDITLRAQAGFDGYCKEERWIPVRVTVENQGADVDARVQVTTKTGQEGRSIYAAEVSLPSTSRKQFFLYIQPPEILRNLTVSVVSGEETLVTQPLKVSCLASESLLVGLLADDASSYVDLNAIQPQAGFVRLAELRISDLPEQAQGWDALDVLVIANVDSGALTAAQRQALEMWLAGGGQLLAVGGPRWQATLAGLSDFLPVEVSGSKNVADLSGLSAYLPGTPALETAAVLSSGQMREGARVLVWQEGVPLLAAQEIGFGNVWYLAADPALQPLNDWDGMAALYNRLFAQRPLRPPWFNHEWDAYSARESLSALSEVGVPSTFLICGWLAFYVTVVGPLNFLLLRRVKRLHLAWVTVPALAVIFTALMYVFGITILGNRPLLNRLAVVQAWQGVDEARVQGLVGVYSPRRAMYTFAAGDGFLSLPFADEGDLQTEGWFSLRQGAQTVLPGVRVERGGMKAVALDGVIPTLPIEHDLILTLDDRGATLSGRVTNLSQATLKEAVLVTPAGFEELGDLPAGSTSPPIDVSFGATSGGKSYSKIFPSSYYYGISLVEAGEEEKARKEFLFQAAVAPQAYTAANWGIYLMGWLDESPLQASLQETSSRMTGATLYVVMLRPSFAYGAGLLRLTPPLFAWESSHSDFSPYQSSWRLPAEGLVLRFKAAPPLPEVSVRGLSLDLDGSTTSDRPLAFLWDFERSEWVEVPYPSWGSIDISAPWRYVTPDGEIRLKLEGDQNGSYELYHSLVTLAVGP